MMRMRMILAKALPAGLLLACFIGGAVAHEAGTSEVAEEGKQSLEKKLSVRVDPRIELLAIVQHFTNWAQKGHIKSSTAYKRDIDDYFAEFVEHPVIALAESLIDANFAYDAPVQFMLWHGDPPELSQNARYPDYLLKRAGGEDNLIAFADGLRDFARKTDFMRFYNNHRPLYDTLISEVDLLLEGKYYIRAIEDFYGESRHSYRIVLSPLFSGNYGITASGKEGYDTYGVIGPSSLEGNRTTFASLNYLESIILHEWSHSFINPLVDQHFDLFKESVALFEPIKGMMRRQAYPTWRVALYEHLVRACGEIHLRAKIHPDFEKEQSREYHEGKGFWYISCIDSLLDVYESRRDKYATFGEFVPAIADRLRHMSIDEIPDRLTIFKGPLDAIFSRTDCIHIVYPTQINEEARNEIKKDLEYFAAFLTSAHIEPVLMSDKEALEIDWHDKVGFLYGNPRDNLFLRRLETAIPLGFKDGAIEFGGKRYEGDGVLIITCMPNPFNEKLPFAMCVANRPEDLIGAGSRIRGPSEWYVDYIIYRGEEKLDSGLYHRDKGRWTLAPKEK